MLNIKDEKGIALVLALVLLAVLSVLAVAMVSLGRHETTFLVKERLSDAALYIADGGVEYGINELQKSTNYQGTSTPYSLGNAGQFAVSVSTQGQPADFYVITSTGYVPNFASFQERRVVRSVVSLTEEVSPVFQYAIASQGDMTLGKDDDEGQERVLVNSDEPQGEGDIYSGGNILLNNNTTVNGDASAVGTITTEGNSTITGERNLGSEPLDFPPIDTARYISEAQTGGTYNGDYKVTDNQYLGPLYINGDLAITGNYQVTLTGTVYVTGSVKIAGTPDNYSVTGSETLIANSDIKIMGNASSGIPLVISVHGNVTLGGNIATQGTIIYAPEGNVDIFGNPDVNGVIVGQTVTVWGSPTITRRVDLTGYPLPGGGGTAEITHVSWQEL